MNNGCLAELAGVHKRYGKVIALGGIDLQVRRGELLAVLGSNGAGKTTAISLLLGLQRPDEGSARLFGRPPQDVDTRRQIGVMLQEAALARSLRVRELVTLVSSYYPTPYAPDEVLKLTHTESLAERPYGQLSGGQKRQAQFALALCGRPKLLFLDEPTTGLDIEAREMIWETLRRIIAGTASIVLTTHYLEEAERLADRVVVLAKGKTIASGTVDELRALVGKKHVSCRTNVPLDDVRRWPGVAGVSESQQRLHLITSNAEAVVRRLMAMDDSLQELEVRRAGLAEAFTELTQEAE